MVNEETGKFTVKLVRSIIKSHLKNDQINIENYPSELNKERGLFVTLEKNGELRGCIGIPEPKKSMIENIKEASKSVCNDPRFPPLSKGELDEITVEVSILTEPEKMKHNKEDKILDNIEINKDGLILEQGHNKGLFLPQVWEKVPNKEDFLGQLCFKAGLNDPSAWLSDSSELYKFQVRAFKEVEPKGKIIEK